MSGRRKLVSRAARRVDDESNDSSTPMETDQPQEPAPSTEQSAPGPSTRLGSLKDPRDVTTGESSSMVPKPKFAPKIPVRRKKTETPAASTPPVDNGEGIGRHEPGRGGANAGRGRGRGRGRYRPEDHMTASGPFAFGPAIRNAIATPTSLPSAPKTEITNQQQEKPTATSEDEGRFDPDDQWSPVIMGGPKKVKKERLKRERAKEKERERIKIKVERERDGQGVVPMDVDHEAETIDVDALTLPTEEKKVHVGPPDEFIKPEQNQMLFFQFPSILPTISTPTMDLETPQPTPPTAKPRKKDKEKEIKSEPDTQKQPGADGRVGKLFLYKSGKMKLKMGDILFDVTPAPETSFLQNLVAVDNQQPACYILGDVAKRYVCTPDVESLLR